MFCSGCGSQIQSGLNYCSRCGRRVAEETKASGKSPAIIAANVGFAGFVSYIFVILVMSKSGVMPNLFGPITFFYFAALVGICFMILRQGSDASVVEKHVQPDDPVYLQPVNTAQLPPTSSTPASVIENTTRTLDEVPLRKI